MNEEKNPYQAPQENERPAKRPGLPNNVIETISGIAGVVVAWVVAIALEPLVEKWTGTKLNSNPVLVMAFILLLGASAVGSGLFFYYLATQFRRPKSDSLPDDMQAPQTSSVSVQPKDDAPPADTGPRTT